MVTYKITKQIEEVKPGNSSSSLMTNSLNLVTSDNILSLILPESDTRAV